MSLYDSSPPNGIKFPVLQNEHCDLKVRSIQPKLTDVVYPQMSSFTFFHRFIKAALSI